MPVSISVVIPAYRCAEDLRSCLESLFQEGAQHPEECIVVDDNSGDDTVETARQFPVIVLSNAENSGPSVARNAGAAIATGDVLLFIDADVQVNVHTVERVAETFDQDPGLTAVMGSYDNAPHAKNFLSQYRNLMHAFFHQSGKRDASTFWSGCGAIRRQPFENAGGFSESYRRPAIEDIELGYRLKKEGHRLSLDPAIQVKHRKRWTLRNMIITDVFSRAVPWTELILREKFMPNDLNTQMSQRISVALVCLLVLLIGMGTFVHGVRFLVPVVAILAASVTTYWVDSAGERATLWATLMVVSAAMVTVLLRGKHKVLDLLLPVALAYGLLALRHRFTADSFPRRQLTGIAYSLYLLGVVVFALMSLPRDVWMASTIGVILLIVVLNWRFYLFLARKWGKLYAIAAVPFHLLYYFYSAVAFGAGFLKHSTRRAG